MKWSGVDKGPCWTYSHSFLKNLTQILFKYEVKHPPHSHFWLCLTRFKYLQSVIFQCNGPIFPRFNPAFVWYRIVPPFLYSRRKRHIVFVYSSDLCWLSGAYKIVDCGERLCAGIWIGKRIFVLNEVWHNWAQV